MTRSIAERYVQLGLRLGRHIDGLVDAYFGPADLAQAVQAEPLVEPRALLSTAESLVDELEDGWLRDQAAALRTNAAVLAGESFSYADEVESYYGVRPTHTDEAVFAAAHEQLDALLPGSGPLIERYERWQRSILVPTEKIESTVAVVIAQAREWTLGLVELPDGEGVDLEMVHDVPWMGFNHYLGDLRGRISVNGDLSKTAIELVHLTLHETYPGHQAERVCKEHLLVRGQGLVEETLVLASTPQSLVTEGLAELAPQMFFDGGGVVGLDFDLAHALAVEQAMQPCRWADVNAALMLHEAGADQTEALAYLQRWGMLSPELAAHLVRFITDPSSRTYIVNYPAGRELCHSFAAGRPERFRRLLTEQIRVSDLRQV